MPVVMTNRPTGRQETVSSSVTIESLTDTEISYRVSRNLYITRKRLGLSRKKVEELTRVNERSIRDYEDVRLMKLPSVHKLIKLCNFYNIKLVDLFEIPPKEI